MHPAFILTMEAHKSRLGRLDKQWLSEAQHAADHSRIPPCRSDNASLNLAGALFLPFGDGCDTYLRASTWSSS